VTSRRRGRDALEAPEFRRRYKNDPWNHRIVWRLFPGHPCESASSDPGSSGKVQVMDSIIYLVGLIVVIMFILSVLGLR
jgi:hypothetical protein